MANPTPLVSILLITYNHGKFIAKAIESILEQTTSYTFVIHVIEDCSTDNTQEVVMEYVRKFPRKVVPHFNKKNIGKLVTQKNFFRGLKEMDGKYFAVLEGDDYWSSKNKLQKQVDFLEMNPDYVACAHNTIKIYEDGEHESHRFLYDPSTPQDHDIERMININSFFHASSMMMRNVLQGNPPSYFSNPWSCDIFMNIYICQYGKIRYFDDDMTVYRSHSGGMFSNMPTIEGWFFNIGGLQRYNVWLKFKFVDMFAHSIIKYCRHVLVSTGHNDLRHLTIFENIKCSLILTFYLLVYCLTRPIRIGVILMKNPEKIPAFSIHLINCFVLLLYQILLKFTPANLIVCIRKLEGKYSNLKQIRMHIQAREFTALVKHALKKIVP
ncbi:glycosyltransferase [Methylophilaceae bacterium]|nr:glycosyltransferase [Methylophilaceae bacterium]